MAEFKAKNQPKFHNAAVSAQKPCVMAIEQKTAIVK